MVSVSGSRNGAQSTEVEQLQAEAREAYARHNSPETQAAARDQRAHAQISGNAAAGGWRGHRR